MNRSLIRAATYFQLCVMVFASIGCAPMQPFFANERPDQQLSYYLNSSTAIEYPDLRNSDLEASPESLPPLTLGNHNYEYWDITLEECIAIALHNAKYFVTTPGTSEERQNVVAQLASGTAGQFGSIYDVALQQTTTQSVPLSIDGNGNRVVNRATPRANQVGGVEDALAEFDAQYSSVLSYGTTDRPRNVDGATGFNSPLFQARDGVQQQTISKRIATGGVVSVRQQAQYSWNNLPVGQAGVGRDVASDWTVVLEAQVTHPLMRGRGTMINRIPVVLARLNEDISIAEYEANVRNLVYDVERLYWDLYSAYRNVESEVIARNAAQATAFAVSRRGELGVEGVQDQLLAESRYYEFRARMQAALAGANVPGSDPNGVYGLERQLRMRMGIESSDGRLIRPVDEPTIAPVDFDWYVITEEMRMNSPELRRSQFQLKQSELELMAAKNRLLPQLDATITGRLVGVGDELGLGSRNGLNFPDQTVGVGAVGSSAWAGLTEGNFAEMAFRLEFTPSAIGQRREEANVNFAKLRIASLKAFIYQQELALQSQLQDAMAKLETHYRLIQTNAAWLNKSEQEYTKRVRLEEVAELGQINLVLDAQQRRAQAQINYYRSLTEYNKSLAYVHYLKGTLLQLNNIALEEGPWNKKAYWDALERARERSAGYHYNYGVTRPNIVSTGTNKVNSQLVVEPMPSALIPEGIADGIILGHEPIDGEVIFVDEPIGSGVNGDMGVPSDIEMMPELQMPQAPGFESIPAPTADESTQHVAGDNGVRQASFDQDSAVPTVKRRPIPKPLTVK